MRKLVLAAAVSVSLAGVTSQSIALGLGEIEIFSSLNENLDAEIGLVDVGAGELNGATASLASDAAFSAAGIRVSPQLRSLRFNVERRPDGESIVKVSSDAPVIEPFLNFLLEIESPSAAPQTREYTVLLDPPAIARQQMITDTAQPVLQPEEVLTENTMADVVGVADDTDAAFDDGGTEVDFSSVSDSDLETLPELIYTTGDVLQLGNSEVIQGDLPAGEDIDLNAEFLEPTDRTEPTIESGSGADNVMLDALAENAIFSSEPAFSSDSAAAADAEINIVDLAVLDGETPVIDNSATTDQVRSTGLSVDLDNVDSDALSVEVPGLTDSPAQTADLIDDVAEAVATASESAMSTDSSAAAPEVTLVEVELITSTDASAQRMSSTIADEATDAALLENAGQADEQLIASADEVLGESVDISGVIQNLAGDNAGAAERGVSGEAIAVNSSIVNSPSSTYTVRSQDTLWSIASRTKPAGVSTRQMMSRILAANESAFNNGDINSMRSGAVLTLPGVADASMVAGGSNAPDTTVEPAAPVDKPADQLADATDTETTPVEQSGTTSAQLSSELDEVDKRMMEAQEELSSEAEQRSELSNRVGDLEDSLSSMKELITLRESELTDLQNGLTTDEVSPEQLATEAAEESRELEVAQSEGAAGLEDKIQEMQEQISTNASLAQERVEAQADADRNLASAEAQVQSLRLANEEDALKAQLAMLRQEKAQLEATAQADKLELVQQAEAEKAQLLANASAERDRIRAELEAEKVRISEEALAERARIAAEAEKEKEQLIAEAEAERDRLAAEGEEMRAKLEALREEKSQLLAQAEIDKEQLAQANIKAEQDEQTQARLQAEAEAEKKKFEEESNRVKDKLAELQAEANANLATSAGNEIDRTPVNDDGVDLTAPALVGGGLAAATQLERELGDRKQVLAAGGGVALLGLLGAWAFRRRSAAPVARDNNVDNLSNEDSMGKPVATRFQNKRSMQADEVQSNAPQLHAPVEDSVSDAVEAAAADITNEPELESISQAQTQTQSEVIAPAVEEAQVHPVVDELVDDTITEADVYLRYGLHGQAEDLLKGAIEKSPDVPEYQFKLLESYHDQKNTAEFKTAAASFKNRFGESAHWERIATMGRELDSSDSTFSRVGAMGAAAAGVAAATGAAVSAGSEALAADDTIDASDDFDITDLEATGDLSDMLPDDLDEVSLDEVDLAALDDDGTLNLEEIAGDQMSGLDLGTLDLTNPDGDSTLDNLTLDDADLHALGDVSNAQSGSTPDIDLDSDTISRVDEMETMLDLAKAYIDMGDSDSAKGALTDIVSNGSATQKMEAQDLLSKLK